MHRNILYFLVILLITSCTSVYTPYKVYFLEPAEVNTPHHIDTLIIVNSLAPVVSPENKEFEFSSLNEALSNEAFMALYYSLIESPRYSEIITVNLNPDLTGTELDSSEIREIFETFGAQALVLLDDFNYQYEVQRYFAGNYYNNVSFPLDPNEYIYEIKTRVNFTWRIYDVNELSIIDIKNIEFKSTYTENSYDFLLPGDGLPDTFELVYPLAINAGLNYSKRIAAWWKEYERYFFIRGNKEMRIATQLLYNDMYDSARYYWEKNTNHPKKRIAERCHYNTAFAYELLANLSKARMWALRAYRKYEMDEARNYANLLYQRILKVQKIEKQMPEN